MAAVAESKQDSADETLERVLGLALRAREAQDSPRWKFALEDALEVHGEACDALWDELYRLLDNRAATGNPFFKPKLPPDPRKELKKQICAAIKDELPSMVASIIDNI